MKVRPHVPGQRTLCGLNQPSGVAHQPKLVCRAAAGVQQIEKALNVVQALRRLVVALVPDSQAHVLEPTQHEHGVQAVRVDKTPVCARPASAVPVVARAKHELHQVQSARVAVLTGGLEPIGQMGCVQLPVDA